MTYFATAALVNTISSFFLGFLVYYKNSKKAINRAFFVYCLCVAFWSLAYFFWQISKNAEAAVFWTKALMAGAIMIPVFQTRFIRRVLGFPVEKRLMLLLYLYSAIFQLANFGDYIVAGVKSRGGFEYWPVAGLFFYHFLLVWIGIVIYNFALILIHYNYVDKKTKVFLIYIAIATIISYIGGITNYPLWLNFNIKPWGNILISVYVIIVAYAVVRNKFLNISLMRSEITVFFIWSLLILDAFLSDSMLIGLLRFGLIMLFTIIGWKYIGSIVENERQNKQLQKDKKELELLDKMKDEFLQMATHELNTPITVIKGRLDMAISENMCNLSEEQKRYLSPILDDTIRLASLSKDILNVARIDQDRMIIAPTETDIIDMINKAVDGFETKAAEKKNRISVIQPDFKIPVIKLDQSKIREVITNLISNANKFTTDGEITVSLKRDKEKIVVRVSDTGLGIEKSEQVKIFKKFYQVDRFDEKNPQEQQGSGLGLYISKNIIELHGGEMWVESEKDKGSDFYFSLPIKSKVKHKKESLS